MRRSIMMGAGAAATVILLTSFVLLGRGLPASAANGSYDNDCCGKIVLRDGTMLLGDNEERSVSYVVQRDAKGPFVLPHFYVGTWEARGFQIDGGRPALRLRLDRIPSPNAIQLHDGSSSFVFRRQTVDVHGILSRWTSVRQSR
jgi:hypothetical protein